MKPPYTIEFDLDGYGRLIEWMREHPEATNNLQDIALRYLRSRG